MTAQTFELNHCYNMDCMEAMAASALWARSIHLWRKA